MLTSRGWSLLGASVGLVAGSILLGLLELAFLAVAASFLVVLGALAVRRRRPRLVVERRVVPHRVSVGDDARVELELSNVGRRVSPVLAVTDAFDRGRRSAPFSVPPVGPSERVRAVYRVPTTRRGRFEVGPLRLSVSDPFGLVRRSWRDEQIDDVVVYPRVHRIRPVPEAPGTPVAADRSRARRGVAGGVEFRSLRDYIVGDDLRRIHWRSTARTGDLMIREDEDRWLSHAALLLDTRRAVHDEASFELAVEATASVVASLAAADRPVHVVTTSGHVLGREREGRSGVLLEELAAITPVDSRAFTAVDAALRPVDGAGTVIAIFGAVTSEESAAVARLSTRFRRVVVVLTRAGAAPLTARPNTVVVTPSPTLPFPAAWDRGVTRWKRSAAAPR